MNASAKSGAPSAVADPELEAEVGGDLLGDGAGDPVQPVLDDGAGSGMGLALQGRQHDLRPAEQGLAVGALEGVGEDGLEALLFFDSFLLLFDSWREGV